MMAARKLDGDDPNIIFMLRCIYGAVQAIAVLLTLFIYTKATAASNESGNAVKIYVPPPPQVSIVGLSLLCYISCILYYIMLLLTK